MFFFPIGGRLVDAFPARYLAITGLGIFAFGAALLHGTDVNTAFWILAFYTIIGRLGQSIMLPAINVSALRALTTEQLNNASGSINFVRLMGGRLAWISSSSSWNSGLSSMQFRWPQHSPHTMRRAVSCWGRYLYCCTTVASRMPPSSQALHFLGRVIDTQAQTIGFQDGFMIIAVVFVAALLPAMMLGRERK